MNNATAPISREYTFISVGFDFTEFEFCGICPQTGERMYEEVESQIVVTFTAHYSEEYKSNNPLCTEFDLVCDEVEIHHPQLKDSEELKNLCIAHANENSDILE